MENYIDNSNSLSDLDIVEGLDDMYQSWSTSLDPEVIYASTEVAKSSIIFWRNNIESVVNSNLSGSAEQRISCEEVGYGVAFSDAWGGLQGAVMGGLAGALIGGVYSSLGSAVGAAALGGCD